MDYFVVRIYRHPKNNSGVLVGVVEEMQGRGKQAFTTYDELWEILNGSIRHRQKKEARKKRQQAGREG